MTINEQYQDGSEQQLIATGSYLADLVSWEYGFTSKDLPQLALQFRLAEGPDAGRTIPAYRMFTDAAIEYTFDAMTTLGWDGQSVDNPEGLGTKQVMLVIEHQEYNGKWSAKVKYINNLTRLNSKPMSAQDRSAFGNSLRGALAKYRQDNKVAGAPAANGARPAAAPPNGSRPAANRGNQPARPPALPKPREAFPYEGFMYYRDDNEPVLRNDGTYVKEGDPVPPELLLPKQPGHAPAAKPDDDYIPF